MIYKKPNAFLHWIIIIIAFSLIVLPTLIIKDKLGVIISLASAIAMFIGLLYIIERTFKIKLL